MYSERSMPIHGFCSRPFPRLSLPISNFPVLQATSPHPPQSRDLRVLCKGNALGHISDHTPGEVYARRRMHMSGALKCYFPQYSSPCTGSLRRRGWIEWREGKERRTERPPLLLGGAEVPLCFPGFRNGARDTCSAATEYVFRTDDSFVSIRFPDPPGGF